MAPGVINYVTHPPKPSSPPVMSGIYEAPPGHLQTNISAEDLGTPSPSPSPSLNTLGSLGYPARGHSHNPGAIAPIPSPEIYIRPAISDPADAAAILQVALPVFVATFGDTVPQDEMDLYLSLHLTHDRILAELNNPNKRFLLVIQEEECVAFAQLTIGSGNSEPSVSALPKSIELQRIYVALHHHGAGLARWLMEATMNKARAEGYENIWLGVYVENARAKKFYTKCGFEKVGEHDFYLGSVRQTDEIWYRSLV